MQIDINRISLHIKCICFPSMSNEHKWGCMTKINRMLFKEYIFYALFGHVNNWRRNQISAKLCVFNWNSTIIVWDVLYRCPTKQDETQWHGSIELYTQLKDAFQSLIVVINFNSFHPSVGQYLMCLLFCFYFRYSIQLKLIWNMHVCQMHTSQSIIFAIKNGKSPAISLFACEARSIIVPHCIGCSSHSASTHIHSKYYEVVLNFEWFDSL